MASYNIRKTRGLDQQFDPHRILAVINQLGADVVALQEADHRLGDRPASLGRELIESETDFKVAPVAKNSISVGWHGNAVLLRKDLSLLAVDHLDMPGLEPRGAVRVDIDIGTPVTVVATHLGLMRRHRRRQLEVIAANLEDTSRAVVLGDFNEWSKNRGLEPLNDRFEVHAPGRSFHAARPLAALDRIAVSKPAHLSDAGVDESPIARRASDHLPVWADLGWSTESQRCREPQHAAA
ncbi:endonuclease/exonuclease/phosphatase family protein [Arenibacterium sp. CAU 1754]